MNKSKISLICKILIALLGVLTVILIIKYLPNILAVTVSPDKFRNYIISLGSFGSVAFISFQILQTIIAPIPGEVIQVAGGYIYGTTLGVIFSTIGLLVGAVIAFYFTRFIGASFIERLMTKKNAKWMVDIIKSKKFSAILFIIFLIPGLPKDFLIYIAGLTPIKALKFFKILLLSRIPWLFVSASIGSNLHCGNYISTIIISIISLVSFVLGLLYKDKLINKLSCNKNLKESFKINQFNSVN